MARELPDYDELEIRLTPGRGETYNVEIQSASGARGRGEFEPPGELEIERFRRTVDPRSRRVRGRSRYLEAATLFGTRLFEQLTESTGVRDVYTTARHDASAAGRGLRLTLSLRAAPELAGIPWEFLYDRPRFLAQHVHSPVVRFVDLEDPPAPLRIDAPLRVLGMVSRPRDADLDALDVDEEQAALERRLQALIDAGAVTLRWLPQATLSALQQEVDHGEDFHVFHYIGHGEYDEETGHSSLILEHPDGRPRRVGGQQLGALLCDRGSLRLAVLNACEAAQTAPQDPLAGIATSLMEYGVPAVVAMQFAITDVGALTFADEFYGALAAGYAVDAAVTQARRALAADSDVEWGTPVLFMRVLDGRLFDLDRLAASPEPAFPPAGPVAPEPIALAEPVGAAEPVAVRGSAADVGSEQRPERSTAPPTVTPPPARPRDRSDRRRRLAWCGAALAALALAAAIVVIIAGGGGSGSGSSTESIMSIDPQPALTFSPRHGLHTVEGRQTSAPGGYQYRLFLSRAKVPPGSAPGTSVAYYFTLLVRHGDHPFVTVQRLKLPYPFTVDSAVQELTLGPNSDGTANVTLSWFRRRTDKNDYTRYFDLNPDQIKLG